jgi:flagellar FliL protein
VAEIEEIEEEESEKKSPVKWIALVVILAGLVGGGYWGYLKYFKNSFAATRASSGSSGKASKEFNNGFGQIYSLDTFVVNLSDKGGKRYLKAKIEVEYTQPTVQDELVGRLPQIRDSILLTLSSKTMTDIQNIEGKLSLKTELIVKINQVLKTGKIRGLFFTEFVIQ